MNRVISVFVLFITIFLLNNNNAYSYFPSKTSSGAQIKWSNADAAQIDVYFNGENGFGISESTLQSIANASATQWNFLSNLNINLGLTSGAGQEGVNEIYYTDDPNIFNSSNLAVAALTQVSYKESNGLIIEADVLINKGNSISTNINTYTYAGNIFTHELGHLLGLDHSQVMGATMFWALSHGQNKIEEDDKAGLYSIYNPSDSAKGEISGKIIGGRDLIGIFGVEVEAISQATGKIAGSNITSYDGTFKISGLSRGDKYFIYSKPSVFGRLSSKYSTVKSNFCDAGNSFRGSFYQACGGSNEGYPQAVSLNSASVDVGKITIRCSLDVPPDYYQKKSDGLTDFNLIQNTNMGIGNAFVGFFSSQELALGTSTDHFKIDLTNLSSSYWGNLSSSDLYLNLRVDSQSFYSGFKPVVTVTSPLSSYTLPNYVQKSDGWIDINSNFLIPIDKVSVSNNLFSVSVNAKSISVVPISDIYILPDQSEFVDELNFYLVNAQIVKSNGDGTYSVVSSKTYTISDNTSCPDANGTYQLSSYASGDSGGSTSSNKKSSALACGTIDTNSNNGSGPFGMIVGFILVYFLFSFSKRLRFI